MQRDEMIWKAVDRRRAGFIAWGRREFAVALRVQFNQWEKATGGAVTEGEMLRAVDMMKPEPIAEALDKVYVKVAGTFAVETERSISKRKQAKNFGATDRTESDYQDQIRAWLRTDGKGADKVVGMDDTSKATMRRIIGQAFDQGLSIEDTSRAIRSKWTDMSKVRAERIARTEVVGASNMGAVAGARATGLVLMKQWISTLDNRTRVSPYDHYDYNLTEVEMNEKFVINGDEIEYPGDPAGQPGNIINCRCTVVFVEKEPDTSPVIQPAPDPVVDDFSVDYSASADVDKYKTFFDQTVRETLRDLGIKGRVSIEFNRFNDTFRGMAMFDNKPGQSDVWHIGRRVRINTRYDVMDETFIKTMKHELRHVWQGDNDKMIMKMDEMKIYWIYWEGKKYMRLSQFRNITKNLRKGKNFQRYQAFPWELDARQYAGQL
jgi:hypothetical protein